MFRQRINPPILAPFLIATFALLLVGCQSNATNVDPAGAYKVEFVNEICDGKKAEEQKIVSSIESARACTTDANCKIVGFGCPFGCAHSINQANEAMLRAQVDQFNLGGCPSCAYRCTNNQQVPRCVAGTCSARDQATDSLVPPSA
jgi:hypothetical protein